MPYPTNNSPRVSVLIPVFNREGSVARAIDSVLAQTFADFELILIDDGSTDASLEIMRSYEDPRIRVEVNAHNMGLPRTLNKGLELARGEYLARLDSDDYAYANRLALQVEFLDTYPDIALVGSWYRRRDVPGGREKLKRRPNSWQEIQATMLFVCCIQHPTITARTQIMRSFGFREDYDSSEDYDLWVRIGQEHQLANLDKELVCCTRHAQQQVQLASSQMEAQTKQIMGWQLDRLGVSHSQADLDNHRLLLQRNWNQETPRSIAVYMEWAANWLDGLRQYNATKKIYDADVFANILGEIWFKLCLSAIREKGWSHWRWFFRSPLWRRAFHSGANLWSNRF